MLYKSIFEFNLGAYMVDDIDRSMLSPPTRGDQGENCFFSWIERIEWGEFNWLYGSPIVLLETCCGILPVKDPPLINPLTRLYDRLSFSDSSFKRTEGTVYRLFTNKSPGSLTVDIDLF